MLDAARRGLFTPLASWDLAEEIVDVLRRPRLRRYRITEDDIRDVLAVLGALLPNVVVDVTVWDLRDAPVVGAAIAGRADAIVTGDKDLLDDPDLIRWLAEQHVDVLDPPALLARLRWGGDPSTPRTRG